MAQDIVRGGGLLYPGDLAVSQLLHPVNGLLHFPALVGVHQLNQMQYQVVLLPLSPFLTGRMFVRPNILRTLRRTMIRFLIEHLVRRIWFGQSKLYFILNWLEMRCKLREESLAQLRTN